MSLRSAAVVRDVTDACRRLLDSLEPDRLALVSFSFDRPERRAWHYVPMERPGLALGRLADRQRELLDGLVRSVLSDDGASTVHAIIDHELILRELEERAGTSAFVRDPGLYSLAVFGEPGTPPWGWRLEGHHLSLNVTITGTETISVLPSFLGANPADVRGGPRDGLRILALIQEASREVVESLNEANLEGARLAGETPWDILTQNAPALEPRPSEGLAVAEVFDEQRRAIRALLATFTERLVEPLGIELMTRIEAQMGEMRFSWSGSMTLGKRHYYRIQGPTLLIEYVNSQDEANHVHTVLRDAELDFGGR